MRFRIEQRLRGSADAVQDVFVDPAFLVELSGLPKVGGAELVDARHDGHLLHRRIRYRFTGELSPAARAVIHPERLTWIEESTLDRQHHRTTWRIVPDHYPDRITCAGTFVLLEADPGRTTRVADADLKVHLALLGGRVEQAIVSGLRDHAAAEERLVNQWLERPG